MLGRCQENSEPDKTVLAAKAASSSPLSFSGTFQVMRPLAAYVLHMHSRTALCMLRKLETPWHETHSIRACLTAHSACLGNAAFSEDALKECTP